MKIEVNKVPVPPPVKQISVVITLDPQEAYDLMTFAGNLTQTHIKLVVVDDLRAERLRNMVGQIYDTIYYSKVDE